MAEVVNVLMLAEAVAIVKRVLFNPNHMKATKVSGQLTLTKLIAKGIFSALE